MSPITDRMMMLVFAAMVSVMITACSAYTAQLVDRDVTRWHPYEFRIDGKIYRIRLPPNGLIIKQPIADIATKDIDDYLVAAGFGYDFGRGSYDDIAQFEVDVGISRINDGLSCHAVESRFGECILMDSYSSKAAIHGHINQYESPGALRWFHETDIRTPWDAYSIMLDRRHYLSIVGTYWRDLAARPDKLEDRRGRVSRKASSSVCGLPPCRTRLPWCSAPRSEILCPRRTARDRHWACRLSAWKQAPKGARL